MMYNARAKPSCIGYCAIHWDYCLVTPMEVAVCLKSIITVLTTPEQESPNPELERELNLTVLTRIVSLFFFFKACKFDFEGGIYDWEKTGTAFNNQPTYGDNPTARNKGQPANQQGDWWIGGYENRPSKESRAGEIQGDGSQGTLATPFFNIGGEEVSFLIGGGCDINTVRAELVINNQVSKLSIKAFLNVPKISEYLIR